MAACPHCKGTGKMTAAAVFGHPGNMNNLRHGAASRGRVTPEYKAWDGMKDRCQNPTAHNFKYYGARGIRVWDLWLGPTGFSAFLEHVGPRPSPKHSIDRIDNGGHYVPGNVRWATAADQNGNTRSNRRITYQGRTQILSDWARELGLDVGTLWVRLVRMKWTPARAFNTPVAEKKLWLQELVLTAGYRNVSDFIKASGMSPATIYKVANHKPIMEATRARLSSLLGVEL